MSALANLSVIVPVGPGEMAWSRLLEDLSPLPAETQILLCGTGPRPKECPARAGWVESPRPGRAAQLNAGARASAGRYLWFLHADTRVDAEALAALERSLVVAPDALHYFDLAFLGDGPVLMRINEAGVRVRSRWLSMPFGDQGLCVSRDVFVRIGPFREDAPYGEDHLLVWEARIQGISLRPTGGVLRTSARKYAERGWAGTTARHMWLTWRQAFPEIARLLRARMGSTRREKSCAVAVFVKTPGLSAVKTRLARAIGEQDASQFHRLSARAVGGVIEKARQEIRSLAPYWAVAEEAARSHPDWAGFETIAQGAGELGDRLDAVYAALLRRHDFAILIGADSPQMRSDLITRAVRELAAGSPFVLGPAEDGGFYLFAGRAPVPRGLWRGIPYSRSDTASALAAALRRAGPVRMLEPCYDVDTAEDLDRLRAELRSRNDLLPEQAALRDWLAGRKTSG